MKLDLSVATTRGSILDSTTRKCTFTVPTLKAWKKRNESSWQKSKCDCDCDLDFRPQWFYNKASTSTTYFIRFQYRSKARNNAEVGQRKIFFITDHPFGRNRSTSTDLSDNIVAPSWSAASGLGWTSAGARRSRRGPRSSRRSSLGPDERECRWNIEHVLKTTQQKS